MASTADAAKLGSVKTEILVAWIFSILVVVGWVIGFLFYFLYFFIILGLLAPPTSFYGASLAGFYIGIGLVYGIIFLVLMIPSILVLRRTGRMRSAANRGDIGMLKQLNSVGWAVVALIFAGVIPGIMLLIANGPINELGASGSGGAIPSDSFDRLTKLKTLLDSKAITQAEYDSQKAAILHPETARPPGIEDELKKLKSLYDSGALTAAEYEEQKKKILSRM
jgi:putative membrane protein